jgi:hypothetical protein
MNRRYEALLVLNTQAKEDNVKEMIERLESEFEKEGAKVEQVQKMDKRHFSYDAGFWLLRELYPEHRSWLDRAAADQIQPGS